MTRFKSKACKSLIVFGLTLPACATLALAEDRDPGFRIGPEGREVDWGETCYPYGRWYDDPDNGWVWVPGSVWGPSWVAWREGDGYSAWAPLPPECGDGIIVTPEVADAYIPSDLYVACDERF